MKAVILAAGKGERLKEISKIVPKPMIRYNGKPVLQYNIELCRRYGITDLFINVHHHSGQIIDYFKDGSDFDVNINYSLEEELLGTSGAVKKIASEMWMNNLAEYSDDNFRKNDLEPFWVIYGDQFSDFNLNIIKNKYLNTPAIGVLAFHHREDVSHSGVAEFDKNGRIVKFIEKPKPGQTNSNWVNAGIYCLSPQITGFIPQGNSDFGKNIFPVLLERNIPLFGVCEKKVVKVFDTPAMYDKSFSELK